MARPACAPSGAPPTSRGGFGPELAPRRPPILDGIGFTVAADTLDAIARLRATIGIVSPERVQAELVKLLATDDPVPGIRILVEAKVDYNNPLNLLLTSIVMGIGVWLLFMASPMLSEAFPQQLAGVLAALVGMVAGSLAPQWLPDHKGHVTHYQGSAA